MERQYPDSPPIHDDDFDPDDFPEELPSEPVQQQVIQYDPNKAIVFAALPHYGAVELASAMAVFTSAFVESPLQVFLFNQSVSSLTATFNACWAQCMNMDFGGRRADYFLMLHSDIVPHGQWLLELHNELVKGRYDVMHAVSPLKDGRGLTSTGIGLLNDSWEKPRRITTKELHELPETFGLEHLKEKYGKDIPGHGKAETCMLCNTGCLYVRLGDWSPKFPGFIFKNRIVADYGPGRPVVPVDDPEWDGKGALLSQFSPEDWEFGRYCYRLGLKVGATRKVALTHVGFAHYTNAQEWGDWKHDNYFFTEYRT